MPLNQKKVVEILISEVKSLENRCSGYQEEINDVIIDIIDYERQHRVQGTNIQQKINDKINAAGQCLLDCILKKVGGSDEANKGRI